MIVVNIRETGPHIGSHPVSRPEACIASTVHDHTLPAQRGKKLQVRALVLVSDTQNLVGGYVKGQN